jgi:hypothetical protein
MPKSAKILSLFAGIVFLFSSIGKSLASHEFSLLLMQYGLEGFRFLAPFVIGVEIILGILLFFCFRLKQTSIIALCFVAILSLVYLYGYFFLHITDCGCFGYLSFLNMPPMFTFIRNFILLCILLCVFLNSDNSRRALDIAETAILLCILCAASFVTGYTYVEQQQDATYYTTSGRYARMNIKNTPLGEFLTTSGDSTYFVFAFSYSCPHCYNSIENLKQYEPSGVVNKVVALSFAADTVVVERFHRTFHPDFRIKNYPPKQLFQLTNQFPTSYYIKNDTVRLEIRGGLPCAYLLLQQLGKIQK